MDRKRVFNPTICLTHDCNLHCVYCYQRHDTGAHMTPDVAKQCIDWIFAHVPEGLEQIEITLIGGEPLLEFPLIQELTAYTWERYPQKNYFFFAVTNGTLLTPEMKEWFAARRDRFALGLSLDGAPDTHNHNRCNSFGSIDLDFFQKNWPEQGVKMTLTEYSLQHLAENIRFLHSIGFDTIKGVNLFEGTFDWSDEKYIQMLAPQLREVVEFYVENDQLPVNQMLDRNIAFCEAANREKRRWCGIGTRALFFDVDGVLRPCAFCTPMTFDEEDLNAVCATDFTKIEDFVDEDCFANCYIYPVCPNCAGANYLTQKTFKVRDKSRCRIQKLITLFTADLIAKRMVKHPERYDETTRFHTINAIQKIRALYLPEFQSYFV